MKVPLSEQIQEAERHRDELRATGNDGDEIDRSEAIILSLRFLQTYETQFREVFMQLRSTNQTSEGR